MVSRRSLGASTQRMLPAAKHEVCTLITPRRIIFNPVSSEYGHADVNIINVNSHVNRLFAGLGDTMPVFMSHFDKLVSLPEVSEIRFCFIFPFIDSNRASWSLVPPRTQSTPVSPMRRSTSLVGLPKPRLWPYKTIC
jgi:hypothetical protein